MQELEQLRYPIGHFVFRQPATLAMTKTQLAEINKLPAKLASLVGEWPANRLDTPYRPEGWTVRQLVHHIADSHLNGYCRTKLALTENNPTIKPYEEGEWATLADSRLDITPSLTMLETLHLRWVAVFDSLTATDLQRTFYHPGSDYIYTLAEQAAQYAWHGEHHYQHIWRLAERNGWL